MAVADPVERFLQRPPAALSDGCWDPRASPCDSQVKAAIGAAGMGGRLVSIGLFALWVGWPAGLALYACGRAARVMRRDG